MDADTCMRIVLVLALAGLTVDCAYNLYRTVLISNANAVPPSTEIDPPAGMNDGYRYFEQLGDNDGEPVFVEDEEPSRIHINIPLDNQV